ncbi:hypothetical protein DFJ74DRAFT_774665 [Hyaloraphidium curvatum]|nr:hypothetical protein DFJ74DRAFT_774665 [Hyaloraphidium curvatum]
MVAVATPGSDPRAGDVRVPGRTPMNHLRNIAAPAVRRRACWPNVAELETQPAGRHSSWRSPRWDKSFATLSLALFLACVAPRLASAQEVQLMRFEFNDGESFSGTWSHPTVNWFSGFTEIVWDSFYSRRVGYRGNLQFISPSATPAEAEQRASAFYFVIGPNPGFVFQLTRMTFQLTQAGPTSSQRSSAIWALVTNDAAITPSNGFPAGKYYPETVIYAFPWTNLSMSLSYPSYTSYEVQFPVDWRPARSGDYFNLRIYGAASPRANITSSFWLDDNSIAMDNVVFYGSIHVHDNLGNHPDDNGNELHNLIHQLYHVADQQHDLRDDVLDEHHDLANQLDGLGNHLADADQLDRNSDEFFADHNADDIPMSTTSTTLDPFSRFTPTYQTPRFVRLVHISDDGSERELLCDPRCHLVSPGNGTAFAVTCPQGVCTDGVLLRDFAGNGGCLETSAMRGSQAVQGFSAGLGSTCPDGPAWEAGWWIPERGQRGVLINPVSELEGWYADFGGACLEAAAGDPSGQELEMWFCDDAEPGRWEARDVPTAPWKAESPVPIPIILGSALGAATLVSAALLAGFKLLRRPPPPPPEEPPPEGAMVRTYSVGDLANANRMTMYGEEVHGEESAEVGAAESRYAKGDMNFLES